MDPKDSLKITKTERDLQSDLVLKRREALKEKFQKILENPKSISDNNDVLIVGNIESYLYAIVWTPRHKQEYPFISVGKTLSKDDVSLLFSYERTFEKEATLDIVPIIQFKGGRAVECTIINLDDMEEDERISLGNGFNEVQELIQKENQKMLE